MKRICLALAFALALATAATAQTITQNERKGCERFWPEAACEKVVPWAKRNGPDACLEEVWGKIKPSTRNMPGMQLEAMAACSTIINDFSREEVDNRAASFCAKTH